ncbi:MAG: Calx-beta domain-containing protein [Steroidobacter sp.]
MLSQKSLVTLGSLILSTLLAGCGGGDGEGGGGVGAGPGTPTSRAGTLQFAGAVSIDEQAGTAQLTVTRTDGSDGAVSVAVASSNGVAIAGQDYTAINTTVNFAAGDTAAKTITVTITDDAETETDETFTVSLQAPTGGAQLGTASTATVTIRDNEPLPAAPVVATNAAHKQLTFTWASVPGATSYRVLHDPDGQSGFTPVSEDLPSDAVSSSIEVSAHRLDWVNALYRVEACNPRGCSPSDSISVVSSMLQAIGYLKASNTEAADQFGAALALSADGRTLAVGAVGEASNAGGVDTDQSNNALQNAGAVYVFTRDGTQWAQQAYVKASDPHAHDFFGWAVALSADGDTLAVGAPSNDSSASGVNGQEGNQAIVDSGAAYVFTRAGGQWSQQAFIKAPNRDEGDEFGSALALSLDGDTLAVGAHFEASGAVGINGDQADNSRASAGAAYVFVREAAVWREQAYVKASNTGSFDIFGEALALSGDGSVLAVGAYGEFSNATGVNGNQQNTSAPFAGAVYVFVRDGGVWSQQAYIKASNTETSDSFGMAIALSADGNTLAVGAFFEDSAATGVNGDQNNETARGSGAVYVFTRQGVQWSQQAYVKASNTERDDGFGVPLALSADGDTLAVAAMFERGNGVGVDAVHDDDQNDNSADQAGAVYVFERQAGSWSQRAYVKASNTQAVDAFGFNLGLSSDGSVMAVGAVGEDSNATGVGGDQQNNDADTSAGAVYVY